MNHIRIIFLVLVLFTFNLQNTNSQKLGVTGVDISKVDLRKVQVDDLSDNQIRSMLKKAEESGYSERDLETLALSRGMKASEVVKLRERFKDLKNEKGSRRGERETSSRERSMFDDFDGERLDEDSVSSEESWLTRALLIDPRSERVYGFHLFNNPNLTFQPSLNIATPNNYILGPGDEVIIDLWGAVEESFQQKISPDGYILVEGVGAILVSGLTVEEARIRIINRLSGSYAGLKGSRPTIQSLITLGELRTIQVNITGEVNLPGTYSLSSLATVFNALFLSAGPNFNGSFREVELIRENKTIAVIDVYDFLQKGDMTGNLTLKDQDILIVKPYKNRVAAYGEIRRPALYEVKSSESLKDVLSYAGGFTDRAYSHRIRVYRKTSREKEIMDIEEDNFNAFILSDGDSILISPVLERFSNRVVMEGAVYRPGEYSLGDSLTFLGLIKKAEGLRGDAFPTRALIFRLASNYRLEVIPVDLAAIIEGRIPDILLHRDDLVRVPSILDLEETFSLQIDGEVKTPGTFPFAWKMTLGDLIMNAGGLRESASLAKVEIARRIKDREASKPSEKIAEIFQFSIPANLELNSEAASFVLEPFDRVFIRRSPGYEVQRLVRIEGEVAFPGQYTLSTKTERLSDLVERAGGLTTDAYLKGARLIRNQHQNQAERSRIFRNVNLEGKVDTIRLATEESIGINLEGILNNPKSDMDLILEEGDILRIPKELQTVRLTGGFLYPVTVKYKSSKSFRYYASQAGGYSDKAMKRKAYVIYANGSVNRTRNYLVFKDYPRIEPGAEIILPVKPERTGLNPQLYGLIGTTLSTMALITVTIINSL